MSYIYEALLRAERERQQRPSSPEDPEERTSGKAHAAGTAPAQVSSPMPMPAPAPASAQDEVPASPLPEASFEDVEAAPAYEWNPVRPSFPTLEAYGRGLEQFRSLRSHLYQARKEMPLKTVLVSSGMPSEGKSFVAANLAMSLARNEKRVLLIDGDLRRPSLNHMLGAPNETGLSDYLAGCAEPLAILQRYSASGAQSAEDASVLSSLTFIPTGTHHENASELMNNRLFDTLISSLSPSFDWIVIDTPPALVFADAIDLARVADAVLLVVRGAQTTYEVARRAQASFANAHILGVVLNDIRNPPRRESYYDDYYYYGKRDAKPAADSQREVE